MNPLDESGWAPKRAAVEPLRSAMPLPPAVVRQHPRGPWPGDAVRGEQAKLALGMAHGAFGFWSEDAVRREVRLKPAE